MPTVTYLLDDGSRRTVEVEVGTSLMKAALANDVPGIVGECGGSATCGTCHVYLERGVDLFAPPSGDEEDMLDWTTAARAGNSRLSCQLVPDREGMDLVVRIPAEQG
ncbi:2Fe-2S iron-sulfur cluster-binding protein [Pseudonocardia sp.]|uniref:2Fe-2S iron-sulfur cluster-binding protein n=1 Tax=Pseudonocardia sp. TaxID=60912 RepID=UPI003D0DD721